MELSLKQRRFAIEYCVDGNGTRAAIRAGYSENTAGQIAHELLKKPDILQAVKEREEQLAAVAGITPELILNDALKVLMADPDELVRINVHRCISCWPAGLAIAEPNPLCAVCAGAGERWVEITPTSKLSPAARALYAGAVQTKDGIKIQMRDKEKARELLAKWLGMIVDKKEMSGPGGGPIPVATLDVNQLSDVQLAALITGQNNINGGNIGGTLLLEASVS